LTANGAVVLPLCLLGANAISGFPLLPRRSRLSHTDEDDEKNKQNGEQDDSDDNGEGDAHWGPPFL
jgi:hypothetical protein